MTELWTPGPWHAQACDCGAFTVMSAQGNLFRAHGPDDDHLDGATDEANARLIALAPEMADVLGVFERYAPTMMRVYGNHFPSLGRPLDDAHQLLVRARGDHEAGTLKT